MAHVQVRIVVEVTTAGASRNTETVDITDNYSIGDNPRFLPDEVRARLAVTVAKMNDRAEHLHEPVAVAPSPPVARS